MVTTQSLDINGLLYQTVNVSIAIVYANPPVNISDGIFWMFKDELITADSVEKYKLSIDKKTLTIPFLTFTDQGVYTVNASNIIGSDQVMITLNVLGKYVIFCVAVQYNYEVVCFPAVGKIPY